MWKDEIEVIDFHSHILPGVDDGAENIHTSVEMLARLSEQSVDKVVSTSHFYPSHESLSSFADRRDQALFKLESYIKEHDIYSPEIIPAAEVRLSSGLWQNPELDKLTIGGSKYILLEMPYSLWSEWMFAEIYAITVKGYTPIIAHLERYVDLVPSKVIFDKLLSMDVLVQCNAPSFDKRLCRSFIKKLVKQNRLTVLGSDCHNMTVRPPQMDMALSYLSRKFGDEYIRVIMQNAKYILGSK